MQAGDFVYVPSGTWLNGRIGKICVIDVDQLYVDLQLYTGLVKLSRSTIAVLTPELHVLVETPTSRYEGSQGEILSIDSQKPYPIRATFGSNRDSYFKPQELRVIGYRASR